MPHPADRLQMLPALAVMAAAIAAGAEPAARDVYFKARQHQTEYSGPGREVPAPEDVQTVLIGYFGPSDVSHPEGGGMWGATQLAIEQANAAGGYKGKPFQLVPVWSQNPWGSGVTQVTRLVYRDHVWAIIGGIDGPSTHLAEQVVAKARLPLLSPASTDKSVNLANVPWMFSLLPGDHLLSPVLAGAMAERIADGPFVLVSATDHDSRQLATELLKGLAKHQKSPRCHFQCHQDGRDADTVAARTLSTKPEAVVVAAGIQASVRVVTCLRESGFQGTIFGGPPMGRRTFQELAGPAAEGVVFPVLECAERNSKAARNFERTFRDRFNRPPDFVAAHAYDAAQMLVAAIRKAGLNRVRIRDAVEQMSPWQGVAGLVSWDRLGSNTRRVTLGEIKNSNIVPVQPFVARQ